MDSHHTLAVCNFSECAPNRGTAAADDDGSVTVVGTAAAPQRDNMTNRKHKPLLRTGHCPVCGVESVTVTCDFVEARNTRDVCVWGHWGVRVRV